MTLLPWLEAFEWLWKWSKRKPKQVEVPPRKFRVLVVEDNYSDAELMREHLRYCGQDATFAENAEAARALIHRNNIDIIFVDMRLTYMPGWELLPIIWRESPHSFTVVICGEISDLMKIPKPQKMFAVMAKPISADDLCELFGRLKNDPIPKA